MHGSLFRIVNGLIDVVGCRRPEGGEAIFAKALLQLKARFALLVCP
jgi:hypothetical protein